MPHGRPRINIDAVDGYTTIEQLQAAKSALIAQMPGWSPPAAYALGVSVDGSAVEWRVTNHRGESLPEGMEIVAVFIGDEADAVIDDWNRQLRSELGIG